MYGLKDWKVRQYEPNGAFTLEETLNWLEADRWNIFSGAEPACEGVRHRDLSRPTHALLIKTDQVSGSIPIELDT